MKKLEELGTSHAPWKVEDTLCSFPIRTCDVACGGYKVAKNVLEADARLIAVAPELYQALYDILEYIDGHSTGDDDLALFIAPIAEVALAKAAGKEAK